MKLIIHLTVVLLLSSCSYFKSNLELNEYVVINSNPSSAEVYSDSGELLGVTPLKLSLERLNLIQTNSIVSLSIKKIEYLDRQLVFKNLGISEVNIKLTKMDELLAKKLIGGPLSSNVNEILKKMVQIQEGVITKKSVMAEESLNQLTRDYPNIASFYVLQAAIDIQNKKYAPAKIILEKSLMLDNTNELAKSYLNFLNQRQ